MPTNLPDALEAGTPNAVGFAGLIAGMNALDPSAHEHEMKLTETILEGLGTISGVIIYGNQSTEGRTPVVLFNIDGIPPREVAGILNREFNIATRGGIHCAPLTHNALGNGTDGGVRVSPGTTTTADEISRCIEAIETIAART